jgi:hypothetical protein
MNFQEINSHNFGLNIGGFVAFELEMLPIAPAGNSAFAESFCAISKP